MVSLPPGPLPVRRLPEGATLYRAHRIGVDPVFFGPRGPHPVNRFDDPGGTFKVCYLGLHEAAALVEGVLHQPVATGYVTVATLRERALATLRALSPLRLVRLHGRHLLALGADAGVIHGEDFARSQSWAAAIHAHPSNVDGILYSCRHDDSALAVALFDRASAAVEVVESAPLAPGDPRTLRLLARYGLGVIA